MTRNAPSTAWSLLFCALTMAAQTRIAVEYPLYGSVFPPDIAAPTFHWRDTSAAVRWSIEGEPGRQTVRGSASARSWRPERLQWESIKSASASKWMTLAIRGFDAANEEVSRGSVRLMTLPDPVGAPIFYRDVPLMPSQTRPGVIKPLAPDAVRLVAWRLRNLSEDSSRLLLQGLPTCANCHSFSRDGRTMGIDVDGPDSDKGTYAISEIAPRMTIRNEDVMTWNSFAGRSHGQPTIGFMSQISPDGRFAVSTVNESVYAVNFMDYRFLQVFYPVRGILAVFSRASGRIEPLPGADDPRYVHTGAAWSPDGSSIVFSRAVARDPYPEGRPLPKAANDPAELPVKYDLYRIPFNGGRGGRPEPVQGASANGMSNTFPKFSPDGKWLVFVRCRNGQLMRPDGELWIVPAAGGRARRMNCNTPLMNSWHSFSPNGRWLVFSSKWRSPYTQMFLTHIDEQGNDTPPILVENATAPDRAVNIPEFVNIPPDGLLSIDVPAAEFYRLYDQASELAKAGEFARSAEIWRQAIALEPGDARAHNNLGAMLARQRRQREAVECYRRAVALKPDYSEAHFNLGAALWSLGLQAEALREWETAARLSAGSDPTLLDMLAGAYAAAGREAEARSTARQALALAEKLNDLELAAALRSKLPK
ncbi:MAG: PD40 domain-containing protein [Bryobacteraceae bacterium]|nr:PD40 domain-containing protein [Bryobacteraceae bacterium]